MTRVTLITIAFMAITLAAIQAIFLLFLPMVDYWREDIEGLLSDRFQAEISISEIGIRPSLSGAYIEALDLIVDHPEGRIEVRRVQMLLNVLETIESGKPVIQELILDGGEVIARSADDGLPDPQIWASLLGQLQASLSNVGILRAHQFDVLGNSASLRGLSIEVTPDLGMLVRGLAFAENGSVPFEMDWRFPTLGKPFQNVRLRSSVSYENIPIPEIAHLGLALETMAWFELQEGEPVIGKVKVSASSESASAVNLEIEGHIALLGGLDFDLRMDSGQVNFPGLRLKGGGGAIMWQNRKINAQLPNIAFDGLELADFLRLSESSTKIDQLLRSNRPRMTLSDVLYLGEEGHSYQLSAKVSGFSAEAARGIPAFGPVNGALYLRGEQGSFHFSGVNARLSLPDVFPRHWDHQKVAGVMAFDHSERGLIVRGSKLQVGDSSQQIFGDLMLDLPRDSERLLHIELLANADHAALPGLMPSNLDSELSEFLIRTISQVDISEGRLSYSGPLGGNVDRTRRELSFTFPLVNYQFRPLLNWPAIKGKEGVVWFHNKRIGAALQSARLGPLKVGIVHASQAVADARTIFIDGNLMGSVSDALEVVKEAGIDLDAFEENVFIDGLLLGKVHLDIPIRGRPEGYIDLTAENLDVLVAGLKSPLSNVSGMARYTLNQGFRAENLQGMLGENTVIADVVVNDQQSSINAQSLLRTATLSQLAGIGFSEDLLSGRALWSLNASKVGDRLYLSMETDGVGLISQLPIPLTKAEEVAGNIKVNFTQDQSGQTVEAIVFENTTILGQLDRDLITLEVLTPMIDLLGWGSLSGPAGERPRLAMLLRIDQVLLGEDSLSVDEIALNLRRDYFDASFDGSDLSGRVERTGSGPILIDLERLAFHGDRNFLDPPSEDLLSAFNPGKIPSLRLTIGALIRGETVYEDVEVTAISGESRLDVTEFLFVRKGQRFQGELSWVYQNGQPKSALVLRADGAELGRLLRVNQDAALLDAKEGVLSVDLTWNASPLGFSMLTSEGVVKLALGDGRFLDLGNSAEALRLFGILNIETLTRRLRLDFLDLINPGLAFDRVFAKARIKEGMLIMDPAMTMTGPSSNFRLTGESDLGLETLNYRLEVDVPLTNNLPIASIILGAPQVGGAIYLAERVLGKKIIKVGKTAYKIEGTFGEPQIKFIPPFSELKD